MQIDPQNKAGTQGPHFVENTKKSNFVDHLQFHGTNAIDGAL